jgi:MYXO-CTERM domain-containing protein
MKLSIWSLAATLAATPALGGGLVLDFETDAEGTPLVSGQIIDDQYAAWGVTISAMHPRNPDLNIAVIQDSSNPPPGDEDQATPGYGPGNDTALGNILVVPGDRTDADGDGLIDDTESQPFNPGGSVFVAFDTVYRSGSVTVVDDDTDETAGFVETFIDDTSTGVFDVQPLGDNSVQTINFASDFNRIQVFLGGSGAFASFVTGDAVAEAVPTPSAVAGGLAVLGLLAARRRRRCED